MHLYLFMRNTSPSLTGPKLPSSIPEGEWLSSVFSTIVILKEANRKDATTSHLNTSSSRGFASTPRAAAVAGIIFSVLFTTSMVLIRLALPEDLRGTNVAAWLQGNTTTISLALTLVPFAGIAFLWFVGVVRSRLGSMEDQFFSTVFFGSGLLFLAMMFVSAAIAGGILGSYAIEADTLIKSGVITFGRAIMYTITNVYGVRMAGVFMISLATIWMRTRVMPRVFVFLTYALAFLLLVSSNLTLWLVLVFPAWVFVISVFILIVSLRGEQAAAEGVGALTKHHTWHRTFITTR